jgi:hypothetical protein
MNRLLSSLENSGEEGPGDSGGGLLRKGENRGVTGRLPWPLEGVPYSGDKNGWSKHEIWSTHFSFLFHG